MTQKIIDPPETTPEQASRPLRKPYVFFSKAGILCLLVLIVVSLLFFSGQFVRGLIQAGRVASAPSRQVTPTAPGPQTSGTDISSIIVSGHENAPPLQLAGGQYVIYSQSNSLYIVSLAGGSARVIPTTGFISSRATPPILTPGGQILYSGDGIWRTSVFGGTPQRIAALDHGQVITSLALSHDGKMLAWSTRPANGSGMVVIHAGPIGAPSIVLSQSSLHCPCFRVFSFMNGPSEQANHTLLLTDDRGSNDAVQYGLWSLDLAQANETAQLIMNGNVQQGPLALSPAGNTLLFSTSEGAVPFPSDFSVPSSLAALSYANSLSIGALAGTPPILAAGQIILPVQDDLSNSAQYHWVTTPIFSPDARTLAYVEFSSDTQAPYDRHSALYTVSVSGSGSQLSVGKPKLLATSSNQLVELGPWINNHVLTIYADGALYVLDIQSGSIATIARPNSYAQIVAVVGQ